MGFGDQLRFYHAPGSAAAAEIFVRACPRDVEASLPPSTRLSLKGPYCDLARMLPATFSLHPVAPGLWQTTVVDPVYWTPLMPAYYRLQVDDAAGHAAGESVIEVGLRRLQVHAKHLILDGRRWVFRGAAAAGVAIGDMVAYHELLLGLVVDHIEPALLQAASRRGVPVIVKLDEPNWAERLRQAARWPAVQFVLLPATSRVTGEQLAEVAPNLVHVANMTARGMEAIPVWADAVMCQVDEPSGLALAASTTRRPVLVCRAGALQWNDTSAADPLGIRRACERLQEQLGATVDASGYLV